MTSEVCVCVGLSVFLYLSLSVGSLVAVFTAKGLSAVIQPLHRKKKKADTFNQTTAP